MTTFMKKVCAFVISAMCAIALSGAALAPCAFATTGHWYFSFSKSDGVHKCGPVKKTNGNNYVNLSIKKSSDNVFTPGKSVLGLRARTSGNAKATAYHTYSYYTDSTNMTFKKDKAIVNHNYYLKGQIDSKSKTNLIQVWGYWTP